MIISSCLLYLYPNNTVCHSNWLHPKTISYLEKLWHPLKVMFLEGRNVVCDFICSVLESKALWESITRMVKVIVIELFLVCSTSNAPVL